MKKLALLALSAFITHSAVAADKAPLTIDVYNAGGSSFSVNSTIVYGDTEVAVIDTGFTKADALRIVANVLDSQKELKTIFISQADPDYYFGAEVLHEYFPKADILATPAVVEVIKKKLDSKLAIWGPRMGVNAPVKPIIPTAYTKDSFTVDGYDIEIRGTTGLLAHRPYLWVPANKTILGNIAVFGNIHLWTADTQSDESQLAWISQLEGMLTLNPESVIPGHMKEGTALTVDNIKYSIDYLKYFKIAKESSKNSVELIEKISAKYPNLNKSSIALSIGAKVHKGEMKW
jgi:glyoxylase-like metal-dependent hydrolase (beta-lactamase superfamily II)